jgi:drug/metabolite transporter (DMT)-like permease
VANFTTITVIFNICQNNKITALNNLNKSLKAHLALLSANIIYGANYSIAKFVMPQHILPSAFIVLRVASAVVLFWISSLLIPTQKIEKTDYKRIIACAVFGIAINQLLFFKGLSLTTPIHASIMMLCTPILVIIISTLMQSDNFNKLQYLGMTISFIAAFWLVTTNGATSLNEASAFGDICILLNALSWGFYLVLVRSLIKKYHTITVMKWIFLIGILIVTPFGFDEIKTIEWRNFDTNLWLAFAYVTIGTTFIAYLLNNYALKALSPGVVSNYIYLQPILASVAAIYLGKDSIDINKIISAFAIFVGVYLVGKKTITEIKN